MQALPGCVVVFLNFIYDAYTGPLQEVDKVIKSGNSLGLKPHASLSFITNFPLFKQK